jgi:hypothetical protein
MLLMSSTPTLACSRERCESDSAFFPAVLQVFGADGNLGIDFVNWAHRCPDSMLCIDGTASVSLPVNRSIFGCYGCSTMSVTCEAAVLDVLAFVESVQTARHVGTSPLGCALGFDGPLQCDPLTHWARGHVREMAELPAIFTRRVVRRLPAAESKCIVERLIRHNAEFSGLAALLWGGRSDGRLAAIERLQAQLLSLKDARLRVSEGTPARDGHRIRDAAAPARRHTLRRCNRALRDSRGPGRTP